MSKPAQWVLIFILATSALAWVPYARYEYIYFGNVVVIRFDRFTGDKCVAWGGSDEDLHEAQIDRCN